MIPWKKVAAVPENLQKWSQLGGCIVKDEQRQEREKDPESKRNQGLQEEVLENMKGGREGRKRRENVKRKELSTIQSIEKQDFCWKNRIFVDK